MSGTAAEINSCSPEETLCAARVVGQRLTPGTIVILEGQLGAGKTVFVRGILQGMGVSEWNGSPTFGLVHEYMSERGPLFHIDAYRLTPAEFVDLDVFEMLSCQAVVLVEWGNQVADVIPFLGAGQVIHITLDDLGNEHRRIQVKG